MNFEVLQSELLQLADRAIEGRLSNSERERLESLVLNDPQLRVVYTQYLTQHAVMQWSENEPSRQTEKSASTQGDFRTPRRWSFRAIAIAVSIALLLITATWFLVGDSKSAVATLLDFKGSKWNAGTLPTEHNSRLVPGRLRLAEGLVRIVFDSGAEVTLESPADFEILSKMKCILRSGRMVAKIPESAHGFHVETPAGSLTDYGTEFGIHVRDSKSADFQVFNGHVDVEHKSSGRTESLKNGQGIRLTEAGSENLNPDRDDSPGTKNPEPRLPLGGRLIHLSTAMGRGKDGYVQPMLAPPDRRSDVLLLLKNTHPKHSDWFRKAYIGFDLEQLNRAKIVDAEFVLTFAPTGIGYAAQVPDATFNVYGLIDETLEGWDEKTLRWTNAPANSPGGAAIDPSKTVHLGNFEIAQGQLSGTRSIRGQKLVDFLNRDTNGIATLILVRETAGSGQSDLVHGFASRRHPELSPPTLKLTCVGGKP